ncbi:NRAMP family divalent metal transporter [Nicoliella lavandulae]|uniref:Divalent metal cation transporter n=1 Tax=Nicoliella lavandulae TaxID=3082954 RepID=A0ABU8SL72_9LACO
MDDDQHGISDRIKLFLKVCGPGLIVMLADTDAGCLITAAQSGSQFGYSMILPQLLLIPILFMAQEMTVRLGIVTKQGHGELIRKHFGGGWAVLSAATLLISVIGALLTEMIGIAGVGELFGISKWITVPFATLILLVVSFKNSYHKVEHIGVAVGLFELMFIIALIVVKPDLSSMWNGIKTVPFENSSYLYLVAANVGAVIMPWMIFYQQGAVIDKKLTPKMIKREQLDTGIGTVITQGIMIGFVVLFAAATAKHRSSPLNTVGDLVNTLAPFLGSDWAKLIMGASILGGALVAAIVVSLSGTWGITEVLNIRHSLNDRVNKQSAGFYTTLTLIYIVGAAVALFNNHTVELAVLVEVINALMLPIVLGFLLLLEAKALPKEYRMKGIYRWTVIICSLVVMGFGLYMVGPMLKLW